MEGAKLALPVEDKLEIRKRIVSPSCPFLGMRNFDRTLLVDELESFDGVPFEQHSQAIILKSEGIVPKADFW